MKGQEKLCDVMRPGPKLCLLCSEVHCYPGWVRNPFENFSWKGFWNLLWKQVWEEMLSRRLRCGRC